MSLYGDVSSVTGATSDENSPSEALGPGIFPNDPFWAQELILGTCDK